MNGNSRRQGEWPGKRLGRGGPRLNRALKSLMQTFYLKYSRSLLGNDVILHFSRCGRSMCGGCITGREAGVLERGRPVRRPIQCPGSRRLGPRLRCCDG